MNIPKLVVRNITRRRGRLVFTLLGITIGIASFVTFLSLGGSLKSEIKKGIDSARGEPGGNAEGVVRL